MANNKPIVVYWTPFSMVNRQYEQLLVDVPFKPVSKDIVRRKPKNPIVPRSLHSNELVPSGPYQKCTAFHTLADNLFYLEFPFDATIELDSNGTLLPSFRVRWFRERGQTIEGAFSIDFLYEVAFFSEEPLEASITPPYLHQTQQPTYGFVTAVKWDIGQWFRPFNFVYQLWPSVQKLSVKQGEPFAYIQFHTERPLVFKQVEITEKTLELGRACFNHKDIFPNTPLVSLYEKFKRQGLRSILLKELKENLVRDK